MKVFVLLSFAKKRTKRRNCGEWSDLKGKGVWAYTKADLFSAVKQAPALCVCGVYCYTFIVPQFAEKGEIKRQKKYLGIESG